MRSPLRFFNQIIDSEYPVKTPFEFLSRIKDVDMIVKTDGQNYWLMHEENLLEHVHVKEEPVTYKEVIEVLVKREKIFALEEIDAAMASFAKADGDEFIQKQIAHIDYLVKAFDWNYKKNPEFIYLKTALKEFKEKLLIKYEGSFITPPKPSKTVKSDNDNRLVWNGSKALLCSLFLELQKLNAPNSNIPLILCKGDSLNNFIVNAFYHEEKGVLIGKESLKKYLNRSRIPSEDVFEISISDRHTRKEDKMDKRDK
ncbi:MAG: hypothetical protein JWP69_1576 [Flaviaesturariibacter sp.]|nr:hypothetical protein [Flaviaesturariibacter sp.]